MKKLTLAQKENYIESPNHCPYCESEDIESGSSNFDSNYATIAVVCNSCHKEWDDVYTLTNIYENEA